MITERQRDVLFWIAAFVVSKRYAPSYQEIADGTGMASKSNSYEVVSALKERGFIATGNGARSIWITPKGLQWIGESGIGA